MAGRFTRTAADRGLAQIHHVAPVRQAAATGRVAAVYEQVERDFGMLAPPVALHSPAPDPLAASWVILRETLVARGLVPRAVKEAVAAAVSLANACPYCVDVHTATMHGVARDGDALAVAADRIATVADPQVRAAATWARTSSGRDGAAGPPPAPVEQWPELVGVAVTFHYFNRMVHVFLPDSPIPPVVPGLARGGFWRLLGRFMWRAARTEHEPGGSLELLPSAPMPDDLAWAAGNPHIAEAFARAVAAVERAAVSVPEPVRDLVLTTLDDWDREPPGISRAWVDDATADLAVGYRPAARLALLTAVAPYQVDASAVTGVRAAGADDQALVELASWASLTAARRVGSLLVGQSSG